MNQQLELFMEVHEGLKNNDLEMVKLLINGQSQESIQNIRKGLKESKLRARLDKALREIKNEQQKQRANDKIRKINADEDVSDEESDENIITKEIKKRSKTIKIEQMFGYAFYGQVKCLMIAYGDLNPTEPSIKMMHSQLETLKYQLFKCLNEQFTKPAKMKHYLSEIFPEEFNNYFSFKKVCKTATENAKVQNKAEEMSEDSDIEESSNEDPDGVATDHMVITTKEEKQYFISLTAEMDATEYERYSQCRSINFLQNKKSSLRTKKMLQFLDPDRKFGPNSFDLELVSFLLCRTVRKIIFRIIRYRCDGRLQKIVKPLTIQEIKQQGNEIISEYQIASSLYLTSPQQEAKTIFVDEFISENYCEIIPKSILLERKKPQDAIIIWRQNKIYQKMWIQRILAQKEVDEHYEKINSGEIDPEYEYSKFILKHYQKYREMGKAFLWKKYFLQENPEDSKKNAKGMPRKQTKLESLKR